MRVGPNAWNPSSNTLDQFITANLGARYELRAVATRGRRMPPDHVSEYMLQYSDDGEGWRTYTTRAGEEEVLRNYTRLDQETIIDKLH